MKRLLTRFEKRQLELIEYLYYSNDPVSIEDLAHVLNCSTRVLKDDIPYINDYYHFLRIHYSEPGLRLSLDDNHNLRSIYRLIYRHNKALNMLMMIFFDQSITSKNLSKSLSVSTATIHRLIIKINEELIKSYQIKLETSPYRIVGKENDIRYFFSQLFSDVYSIIEWPFEIIDEKQLEKFILTFTYYVDIQMDYTSLAYIKIIVAVNLIRTKAGYYCDLDYSYFDRLYGRISREPKFNDIMKNYEKTLHVNLSKETIGQLFNNFVHRQFIFTVEQLLDRVKVDETFRKTIRGIEKILDSLSKKNKLMIKNKHDLLLSLYNILHLNKHDLDATSVLYNRKKQAIDRLESMFPAFHKQLKQAVTYFMTAHGHSCEVDLINHFMVIIFTHWENLVSQLLEQQAKVNLLILTTYDSNHIQSIADILLFHFNNFIHIIPFEEVTLSKKLLEESEADLIISTFPLSKIKGKEIINIQTIPSERDLITITRLINKIYKEKKAATFPTEPSFEQ